MALMDLTAPQLTESDGAKLHTLPRVNWKQHGLEPEISERYLEVGNSLSFHQDLRGRISQSLLGPPGFLLVKLPRSSDRNEPPLSLATVICCLIGRPIKVMNKLGLWLDVPVKLHVEPFRFGGTGYIPFHIDVINSTHPPDVVGFLCERPDPLGGGATILSDLQSGLRDMSEDELVFLSKPQFRDGQFYDISEVGRELNPFPVLMQRSDGSWQIRFTGKMLYRELEGEQKRVLRKLENALGSNQHTVNVQSDELILINQNIVAHGRMPLGSPQEAVAENQRRLLHQIYLRL